MLVLALAGREERLVELEQSLLVVDEQVEDDEAVARREVLDLHLLPLQLSQLVEALLEVLRLRVTHHIRHYRRLGQIVLRYRCLREPDSAESLDVRDVGGSGGALLVGDLVPEAPAHDLLPDLLDALDEQLLDLGSLAYLVCPLRPHLHQLSLELFISFF